MRDAPILYLEAIGGISGDMFLAAMLDLCLSEAQLEAPLRGLNMPGWKFTVKRAVRHHIQGTQLDVVIADAAASHTHRRWVDIDALIEASQLSHGVKEKARHTFKRLGEAEAKIHGMSLKDIAFHEVGAVDSIVDICGAAVALEALGNPTVYAAPPPLGSGNTHSAHGITPIPAPATLELLRDMPVRFEGAGEMTTPTGAALLQSYATIAAPPAMRLEKVGYGIGTQHWEDRPNVLRASLGVALAAPPEMEVLEANLDDCNPQLLGALLDMLFARGAVDVWVSPVVMKKGRPGHLLGVLTNAQEKAQLVNTLLEETSTLGVRATQVTRTALSRRYETVHTPWGHIRIKLGLRGEQLLNAAPEFEDCLAAAKRAQVPIKQVQAAAMAAWKNG